MSSHEAETEGASEDQPGAATPPAGSATPGAASGTQAPAGFVPQAELDRERERARTFQADLDRTKAALAAATKAPASGPAAAPAEAQGFDPESYRSTLLREVASVARMAQAATAIQTEFPYADSSLFDRLDEFTSVEALRLAAEDSHRRVASLVEQHTDTAAIEARLRAEFEAKYGQGGTPAGSGTGQAGDPTPEELARMTPQQLHELEAKHPGLLQRVLESN